MNHVFTEEEIKEMEILAQKVKETIDNGNNAGLSQRTIMQQTFAIRDEFFSKFGTQLGFDI